MFNYMTDNPNEEAIDDLDSSLIKNHVSGGLPMISDSMFSLVILIYVSAAFCFVFFMFCWNNESGGGRDTGIKHQCILMANNIAKRGGVGDLPTETEETTAAATTARATASDTLKRAVSLSEEDTASSAAAAAADATGILLLTTDYEDKENDEPRRECHVFYTHMTTVARKAVSKDIVVCRTDNSEATTATADAMGEDGEHINIESETTVVDI